MIGSDQRLTSVIEIPEGLAAPITADDTGRKVRSLEMLGPFAIKRIDTFVNCLQLIDLRRARAFVDHYNEVDVAVLIEIPNRERSL